MTCDPPPPAPVAAALALRPFAAATTRRDLSTSTTAFRTAWAALSQVQVLQQTCTRVAERAANVLCAVFARLEELDHEERAKLQGRVVLERSYEFQAAPEGQRGGAETIFKIQAAMLDLQAFATDFLALSTGPSRLDLLVMSLPISQRALATLSSSLSALLAHYALPHPASPAAWAAEDAIANEEDERALPRLFQRALALRGDAWQRFLAEHPAPVAGAPSAPATPSQRRSAFVAWCVERNPLLGARAGEGGEEGGSVPRRRRQEASWPPAPPGPTPSAPSERLLVTDSVAGAHEEAPPMRRAASQPAPASGPSGAGSPMAPSRAATTPFPGPRSSTSPAPTPPLECEPHPAVEHLAARPSSPPTLPQPPPVEPAVVAANDPPAASLEPVGDVPDERDAAAPAPMRSTSDLVEPLEPLVAGSALGASTSAPSSTIIVNCRTTGEAVEQAAPSSSADELVVDVPAILLTSEGGDPIELAGEPRPSSSAVSEPAVLDSLALVGAAAKPSSSSSSDAPALPVDVLPPLRILALDGGTLLGPIPQLDLLRSILDPAASPSSSGSIAAASPAKHFVLLAGTAASALLAVLLGRFALDLDAAHALYVRIARRALALEGPASLGARTAPALQRRRASRWSRLFRRSSGTQAPSSSAHERETGAAELASARGRALAAALAELLPGVDEPFAAPRRSPDEPRVALLAFSPGVSGRPEPAWLVSDDPASAHGLTLAQAVLAAAAASPLVACAGWCASPTSLSTAQGALELGLQQAAAAAAAQGVRARVELVSLGTGYASLRLPPGPSSVRRAALEAAQQAAAANSVAAEALARKLEGREDVELRRTPLKKRASRLSFLFGSPKSRDLASSPSSPSRQASPSAAAPRRPPPSSSPPSSPISPALTVPRLRTSISLDDLRRCGTAPRGSAREGEGAGRLYALGEEAWGSSASARSG
ncbi:hypothetical protein JCM9279_000906 [Rhodotorula babjevae]